MLKRNMTFIEDSDKHELCKKMAFLQQALNQEIQFSNPVFAQDVWTSFFLITPQTAEKINSLISGKSKEEKPKKAKK